MLGNHIDGCPADLDWSNDEEEDWLPKTMCLGSAGKTNFLTVPGAEPVSMTGVVLRIYGVSFFFLKRHGQKMA